MRELPNLPALLEAARTQLGLEEKIPGRAWWVHRPGHDLPSYAFVEFGLPSAVVAVAAVDPTTGQPTTSARLPGVAPHLSMNADEAVIAAGRRNGAARLVWAPSRQSASPLYPLWEVSGEDGSVVYVDLGGRVWPSVEPGGPGG